MAWMIYINKYGLLRFVALLWACQARKGVWQSSHIGKSFVKRWDAGKWISLIWFMFRSYSDTCLSGLVGEELGNEGYRHVLDPKEHQRLINGLH